MYQHVKNNVFKDTMLLQTARTVTMMLMLMQNAKNMKPAKERREEEDNILKQIIARRGLEGVGRIQGAQRRVGSKAKRQSKTIDYAEIESARNKNQDRRNGGGSSSSSSSSSSNRTNSNGNNRNSNNNKKKKNNRGKGHRGEDLDYRPGVGGGRQNKKESETIALFEDDDDKKDTALTTSFTFISDRIFFGEYEPKDISTNPFTVEYKAAGIRLRRRNANDSDQGIFIGADDIKIHQERPNGIGPLNYRYPQDDDVVFGLRIEVHEDGSAGSAIRKVIRAGGVDADLFF